VRLIEFDAIKIEASERARSLTEFFLTRLITAKGHFLFYEFTEKGEDDEILRAKEPIFV
jgi:hypothetical protein